MTNSDHLELRHVWITEAGGWEFFVNGRQLGAILERCKGKISAFCALAADDRELHINRLLGKKPDSIPSGRTRLLVCSICGGFGCGAITMKVRRLDGQVEWSDFTDEADYEEYGVWPVAPALVLRFDAKELEQTLCEPFR